MGFTLYLLLILYLKDLYPLNIHDSLLNLSLFLILFQWYHLLFFKNGVPVKSIFIILDFCNISFIIMQLSSDILFTFFLILYLRVIWTSFKYSWFIIVSVISSNSVFVREFPYFKIYFYLLDSLILSILFSLNISLIIKHSLCDIIFPYINYLIYYKKKIYCW
jgi:hypothetical protein